ncbi:MAG: gamma-glutamyl-gamma-aminobutyrate hydrolase family protein [Candidatus Dormibacteraeota bacterium]|nr:gamma-glutamyl-gamma-aminobutyrate hydrolase family protein [Candidatus Dormibacteraeota bacterium]
MGGEDPSTIPTRAPRVAITSSSRRPTAYYETYARALAAAGGDAVLIQAAPGISAPSPEAALAGVDGLLVPGGWDVDPGLYAEARGPALGPVDEELDRLEVDLVRAAVSRRLPVLGICRGQQLINVALGGTLLQHVEGHDHHDLDRSHLAHTVSVETGSELALAAEAAELSVNSLHHQAIRDLAPGLRATALSPDGLVEALESDDGAVMAVQCHPEELVDRTAWALPLIARFVARAGEAEGRR